MTINLTMKELELLDQYVTREKVRIEGMGAAALPAHWKRRDLLSELQAKLRREHALLDRG